MVDNIPAGGIAIPAYTVRRVRRVTLSGESDSPIGGARSVRIVLARGDAGVQARDLAMLASTGSRATPLLVEDNTGNPFTAAVRAINRKNAQQELAWANNVPPPGSGSIMAAAACVVTGAAYAIMEGTGGVIGGAIRGGKAGASAFSSKPGKDLGAILGGLTGLVYGPLRGIVAGAIVGCNEGQSEFDKALGYTNQE